jgi:hypothetical protein
MAVLSECAWSAMASRNQVLLGARRTVAAAVNSFAEQTHPLVEL